MPTGRFVFKTVNTFVGAAAVTACLTVLFQCARAVMEIGGSCASGGPYVVARPCPEGIGWMTPVSIVLGLVSLGWMAGWNSGMPGPKLAMLGWPALFLSLGWAFWEFGLDPPGDDASTDAGFIVCGVIFVLMGGLPLLALKSRSARRALLWADAPDPAASSMLKPSVRDFARVASPKFGSRTASGSSAPPPRPAPAPPPPAWATAPSGFTSTMAPDGDASTDLVAELQHLAAMHRDGLLTDEEFALAKQRILREP